MAVSQDVREDTEGNAYVNINSSPASGMNVNVISTTSSPISSATISAAAQDVVSAVVLASSGTRKGFIMENNSISVCYLAFGGTAVAASGGYSRRIQPNAAYEAPDWVYTGDISAIWAASGSGFLEVTAL